MNIPTDPAQDLQPTPDDSTIEGVAESGNEEKEVSAKDKKRWAEFRHRTEVCKQYRKKLVKNWSINIDYRRGKQNAAEGDEENISVNLDWSNTKTKQASLYSQNPKVRVDHSPESLQSQWVPAFERKLNDILLDAGIESAMDEVMPDCINAAGIGVILVAREALMVNKDVPELDLAVFPPNVQKEVLQTGKLFGEPIQTVTAPQPVDSRYTIRRISPADFLWPIDFTGSDFDNAPWLGYTGRITWAEAVSRFGLSEDEKSKLVTEEGNGFDKLTPDTDKDKLADDSKVGFDEIFYHEFQYGENPTSFKTIHHLVFLHGKNEPVIDEPWKGQEFDEENNVVKGCLIKPLRTITLTYLSDEDIPPSDSAIVRSQVNELARGRTHIAKQRARSSPLIWGDINRLDPMILQRLMRGTWDGMIPVQGDGTRVIGTIQQPAMHQENFLFDKIAKADAAELFGAGPNQMGVGDEVETKGEANVIQSNFQTKNGRERAKVASFVCGIAQVIGGFMCLYEDAEQFGEGFDPTFSQRLKYSILADSTVLIDSNQRLERLNYFMDKYTKTGWVNLEPVLKEIATLIGLDPNTVIVAPQPKTPPEPNISLRLTGGEDMMNPLLLAFMIKAGQAPDPKLIEQAKALIQGAVLNPVQQPGGPGQMPPAPAPPVGEANPEAALLPSIGKRSESTGNQ